MVIEYKLTPKVADICLRSGSQLQNEKHPRANGGDDRADDFGGGDVFDDLFHPRDLIGGR